MSRTKVWFAIAACVLAPSSASAQPKAGLEAAYQAIHAARFVDLTHTFSPSTPHWPGFPAETAKTIYTEKKDGFTAQLFTHIGQWGTHVDAPAHFHERLHTVDQIDPKEFLLRLVVFDVHDKVKANPDYVLTMDDVRAWEKRHGPVPRGAFAVMRTDWSKRWPSEAAMQNKDAKGVAHFPGWSMPVMKYLYEQRGVTASGHETSDTGPGVIAGKGDFSLESYILGLNHFQIEFLANLDQVPESGALAMVTFPKPEHGSGFPARVVAIAP